MTEIPQQEPTSFVVAHDTDRENVDSKIGKIVGGIGCAARQDSAVAVFQDQYRRFARHARDFAKYKLVGHEVAQHRYRDVGEVLDDFFEPLGFFGVLRH